MIKLLTTNEIAFMNDFLWILQKYHPCFSVVNGSISITLPFEELEVLPESGIDLSDSFVAGEVEYLLKKDREIKIHLKKHKRI